MVNLQRLAIGSVVGTYLLIVAGATVRVSGAGLGCPDWPLCHGGLLPPLEFTALLEYSHRLLGAVVSLLLLATVAAALLTRRRNRALVLPAVAVPVLLALQIPLGGLVVFLELPPLLVFVHLGIAMLILGTQVWLAVASAAPPRLLQPGGAPRSFARLAWVTAGAVYLLIMAGAYVRATGAGWACLEFPTCRGEPLPFGISPLVDIHLAHRVLAYGVGILVAVTMVQAWRTQSHIPAVISAASALGITFVAQIAIGASMVLGGLPPALRGLHVAGAAAVWVSALALASLSQRSFQSSPPDGEPFPEQASRPLSVGEMVRAYLSLTKPGIIVLLLITTIGSMLIATRGSPDLSVVLFTLLGGALSAGAANSLNCFLDRDIDRLMKRTSLRPLPSGIVTPPQALRFGLILAVLSFVIFTVFVNLLAAVLSLAGLLIYVFVYTRWLKRSSPSNIVIGGAAGAMPPMVGWAAATGEVSLLAFFLFAIIFYWTPPHFWALALLIRSEYEKAGVPMLPVVQGEAATRHQIFLYSLLLVSVTLVLVPLQMLGLFYLVAAALLGGLFVYYAVRLLREADRQAAIRLYKYSLAYLALLFMVIVLDRRLFV